MKKLFLSFFVFVLFYNSNLSAQTLLNCYLADTTSSAVYRDHNVDIQRMKLEVSFEPTAGKVIGKVTHYFTPNRPSIDTLFLDAPGITIQSCKLNGSEAKYTTNEKGITIRFTPALTWDKNDSVTIEYTATPKKGIYFIGWQDSTKRCRRQLWTQGEAEDNRFWIPMYDNPNDKYITETVITFDKEYNVLSNGLLLNGKKTTQANMPATVPPVNADGKTRTWHYKMSKQHSGYLLMLAIGNYAVRNFTSSSGVKMASWYYPDWEDRYEPTFKYVTQEMDFLEKETGVKYPWDCFANVMVQDFIYGAMENTSAVIFGDFFTADARSYGDGNYVGVDCHEMTHQWFGDLITCKAWNDGWLHESFATYYPQLFTKQIFGQEAFEWSIKGSQNSALDAGKKDRIALRNSASGTARVYQKGSVVIDMLRYVIGDEAYRKSITYYLNRNGYNNVAVNNFEDAFKDEVGASLDWFFNEWIYRGGEPVYNVNYQALTGGNNNSTRAEADKNSSSFTRFNVSQTQPIDDFTGVFKMPIVFQVYYTDGSVDSVKKMISKQNEIVDVPNPQDKKISFVLFDPGNHILKTVNFKKGTTELLAQLANAPHMIDRYDALVALQEVAIDNKRNALIESFKKEKFYAMKAEIVKQLAADKNSGAVELVSGAFNDKDVNVRVAAINNAPVADYKKYFEKGLEDSSYNIVQTSLVKLIELNPANAPQYLQTTSKVYGVGNRVRIKWLELAAQYLPQLKQQCIDELVDMTSYSFEFRTRISAAGSLKALNYLNDKLTGNLFEALLSTNSRLAGGCKPYLDYFYQQIAYKTAIQNYYHSHTWTNDQKKVLDGYGK